jgi:integrase
MEITQAIRKFLTHKEHTGRASDTLILYNQILRGFSGFLATLGITRMEDITNDDLRTWITYMEDRDTKFEGHSRRPTESGGLSPYTIERNINHTRSFLRWYDAETGALACAYEVLAPPKIQEPPDVRDKAVSPQDLEILLEFAEAEANAAWDRRLTDFLKDDIVRLRDFAVLRFLCSWPLRAGELCSLRLHNLDLEERKFEVRAEKVNTVITGYLNTKAVEALQRYLVVREWYISVRGWTETHPVCGRLFITRRGALTTDGLSSAFRKMSHGAGITPIGPHAVRHRFGEYQADRKVNTAAISRIMGHSDTETTIKNYVHQSDEKKLRKIIEETDLTDADPTPYENVVAMSLKRLEEQQGDLAEQVEELQNNLASQIENLSRIIMQIATSMPQSARVHAVNQTMTWAIGRSNPGQSDPPSIGFKSAFVE